MIINTSDFVRWLSHSVKLQNGMLRPFVKAPSPQVERAGEDRQKGNTRKGNSRLLRIWYTVVWLESRVLPNLVWLPTTGPMPGPQGDLGSNPKHPPGWEGRSQLRRSGPTIPTHPPATWLSFW